MGLCEKILVDKVVCDDILHIKLYESDIKIKEIAVPPGSTVEGNIEIAILESTPVIDKMIDKISARIVFLIQKELLITTPDSKKIPLEFAFRTIKKIKFKKCIPSKLQKIDPGLLDDLECRVIYVTAKDVVTLHPSNPPNATNAAFDEKLNIKIKVKLVQQKQLNVYLCPPRKVVKVKNGNYQQ